MRFKKIRDNVVHYTIYLIIGFIVLSTALSFWNRYVTYDTRSIIDEADAVISLTRAIRTEIIEPAETGLALFSLDSQEESLSKFYRAYHVKDSIFKNLEFHLKNQGYDARDLASFATSLDEYFKKTRTTVSDQKTRADSAFKMSVKIPFSVEADYKRLLADVTDFEKPIREHAESDYQWSITDNAIIQIILVMLSVPILINASQKLRREVNSSQTLLRELEQSNRKYLYNDASPIVLNSTTVVEKSIAGLRRAFDFIQYISKAEYKSARELIPNEMVAENANTLIGALRSMSIKLENSEEADKQRQWVAEGVAQFYEVVRAHQSDLRKLSDHVVSYLTKYLHAQQGSLFILNDEAEPFLELKAAYAFEKKKWLEKRIEIGSGLVGQSFLEGQHVLLTEIPAKYLSITSGLGEAMPRCLLIMPFKYDQRTEAVLEVASFAKFENHHIEFLKRAGEIIAATLQSVKKNTEMERLLTQSQLQAEALKAQEEELRQNMEELEATNESIRRRGND